MCGIAGKLYFDRARRVDPEVPAAMNQVLAHRGPDDEGVHLDGALALAHRRLSIVDLSPAGHQPMANAAGTLWITYNGEIYNFPDLRAELEAQGVRFRSRTDTEVILALYEREGIACLERLRGMFAFGLWDARRRTLVLVRDRLGKKPLHYYVDDEKALFASEPKALFVDPEVPVDVDLDAIHHYLTYGYVPAPRSAFRGVRKVPPGHYVEIGEQGVTVRRYWSLRYRPKLALGEAEACEALLALLREAIRMRLLADVPVGAFLSGGIDSSALVALMSEAGRVKTFSIGFEDAEYDELPYARLIAERYATDHHEFVVKPDAVAVLPHIVWHYGEPYADSSAIPTYYLSELARRHVTVALNGDAGDENFAGYERYRLNDLATRYDRIPAPLKRCVDLGIWALPPLGSPKSFVRRVKRFWRDATVERRRRYARWMTIFSEADKATLYTPELRAATAGIDPLDVLLEAYDVADTDDFVDATLGADIANYLPDDLLTKFDIAGMAHALEARSPMVDHIFMEFVARLPSHFKLRGADKKHIFKRAVAPLVPREIIARPKQGFGVPISGWLKGPVRELMLDTLFSRASLGRGLFDPADVRRRIDEHDRGIGEHHPGLWTLLMLELWYERFIDHVPRAPERLPT
jgi:asparagine synthase (glutamine-hydrolysing)